MSALILFYGLGASNFEIRYYPPSHWILLRLYEPVNIFEYSSFSELALKGNYVVRR